MPQARVLVETSSRVVGLVSDLFREVSKGLQNTSEVTLRNLKTFIGIHYENAKRTQGLG